MEEVKRKVKSVQWSNTVKKLDSTNCKFPILVKPTAETAVAYSISENDVILLHHVWVDQRIVAQTLEDEGAYVVGPQLEISSEYTGTFNYRHDYKREIEPFKTFSSVKDIATSLPRHVFTQEKIIVYPPTTSELHNGNSEKERSIILQAREQLTVIEKKVVHTTVTNSRSSYLEQMFKTRPKAKLIGIPCLAVRKELTQEIINLPLSTHGKFATISYVPAQNRELCFKEILTEVDLPITLTCCRNCPRTLLDEHMLKPGMNLRMTSDICILDVKDIDSASGPDSHHSFECVIEEHELILGTTLSQKTIEFASSNVSFILSKYTEGTTDDDQNIHYQTALQRFLIECEMKNSPVNIKDYKRSTHNHVARTVRLTHPKVLNQVASLRVSRYSEPKSSFSNGVSVIQLMAGRCTEPRRLSLPLDSLDMNIEQSTQRVPTARRAAPLPPPPLPEGFDELLPPLPPRNTSTVNRNSRPSSLSPRRKGQNERPVSFAGEGWNDYPKRPPPPTPVENSVKTLESTVTPTFDEVSQRDSTEEDVWLSVDQDLVRKIHQEVRSSLNQEHTNALSDLTCASGFPDTEASTAENIPIYENSSLRFPSKDSTTDTTTAKSDLNYRSLDSPTFQKVDDNRDVGVVCTSPSSTRSTSSNEYLVTDNTDASNEDTNFLSISAEVEINEASVDETEKEDEKEGKSEEPELESETDSLLNDCFRLTEYVVKDGQVTTSPVSFTCNYVPPPENWTPPDDLTTISVSEVGNSLRFIGMNEDTVEWFIAEKVDGKLLCAMDNEMLMQHFRLTPFQQKKLLMFMKGWRPKFK